MLSNQFSLTSRDFWKGVIMAVVVPFLLAIQESLAAGELTFNWKALGLTALASFVGYILKNFLTNDVPAAEATIQEAQQKAIAKQ